MSAGNVGLGGLKSHTSLRLPAVLLLVCLIVSSLALISSALAFQGRVQLFQDANGDSKGWSITQLERDRLVLMTEIRAGRQSDSELGEAISPLEASKITEAFDIYYSRVAVTAVTLQRHFSDGPVLTDMAWLKAERERLTRRFDAMDFSNPEDVAAFLQQLVEGLPVVRDIAVDVLQHFISQSQEERETHTLIVRQFATESMVLLVLTFVSCILAVRLWRELESRAAVAQRAAEHVTKAYDVSPNAVILVDGSGTVLQANAAGARILGFTPALVASGLQIDAMIPASLPPKERAEISAFLKSGVHADLENGELRMTARKTSGEELPIAVSVSRSVRLNGDRIFIIYVSDMSAQVAAEQKLTAARDEAERSASAKSMFLATMSHEMRTPLHGVIASLDLVGEENSGLSNASLLKTARHCADRALSQVNDILDLTRLGESREVDTPFSPVHVVEDIIDELRPLAMERGNYIELRVSGERGGLYLGAANSFARVIYNLAGNAVKFTSQGTIALNLDFVPRRDGDTLLALEVTDTGIGIAEEDLERIFDEFETLGMPDSGSGRGTGLGLAIAQLAARRLGSELDVESEVGVGSTFSMDMILRPCEEPRTIPPFALPESDAMARKVDVLIADDNEVNRALMREMVSRLGHRPDVARNGAEAVALAARKPYDLVLMDVNMPVLDGLEATSRIRCGGASQSAVILGVTALVSADETDYQDCGMDAVLAKPLTIEQLYAAIGRHLSPRLRDINADRSAATLPPGKDLLTGLSALVGGNTARKLLRQTFKDVDVAVAAMKSETLPDEERISRIHAAVGSTGMVGFAELSSLLSDAERALLDNKPDALGPLVTSVTRATKEAEEICTDTLV